MNTLPPELHGYICELATSDDGVTVRSLSQVSRYFGDISKPFVYRNVSISGHEQLFSVLGRLEATPCRLRHIRHLFIDDTLKSTPPPNSSQHDQQNLLRNFIQLIALAAPTLESLALISHSPLATTLIARIFRTHFPRLCRLTISGFYPFPSSIGKFPRLQHLHLAGNRNPTGLLQMSTLEDAFPSLESIRISDLYLAGSFVIELAEALDASGKGEGDSNEDLMPARLPRSLRSVTVQAGPPPLRGPRMAAMKDCVMMNQLEALKTRKRVTKEAVEVKILNRSSTPISAMDIRTYSDSLENCY